MSKVETSFFGNLNSQGMIDRIVRHGLTMRSSFMLGESALPPESHKRKFQNLSKGDFIRATFNRDLVSPIFTAENW